MDMSQYIKKVAASQVTQGGTPVRDGTYKFALVNFLIDQKSSGVCCIIELLVKESRSKAGLVDGNGTPRNVEANPVGSTCSLVYNLSKTDDAGRAAPGNVKAFVCGIAGYDPATIPDEKFAAFCEQMRSKAQPLRGMLVGDDTFARPIKKGPRMGQMFVGHNWVHVPGQTPESIRAEREAMEKAGVCAPV
jgi:hypothetical protein